MRRLSVVLLAALAVAGCKKKEPAPVQQAAAPIPAERPAVTIKGKVVEKLEAPPYSYLKIKTADGESWTAVPQTPTPTGAEVVVKGEPMTNFDSKQLKRKFELVYFGTLGGADAGPPPAMAPPADQAAAGGPPPDMAALHAAAAAGPTDVGNVKVAKASGADARTVAEVHAQRAALKEKSVTVRGKVVKYNEGIMGRNWIHIRDGTGTAGKDNDLAVTTNDKANIGDVVVVKGVLQVEKNIGSGYHYPVIIEDAKISK